MKLQSCIAVALYAGICHAGAAVLFETDFSQLPQGWIHDDDWVLGSAGASLCVSVQDSTLWSELSTEGEPPARYFVPDGTDSVVVEVDHWIFLSAGNVLSRASSTGMIQLWTSESGWGDYIFYHSVSDTLYAQEQISSSTLLDIPQGTELGFRFRGELVSENQGNYAEIIWQVAGMTVTAYGEEMGLTPDTWGSIKTMLDHP